MGADSDKVIDLLGQPSEKIHSKIEIDKLFNEDLKEFNEDLNVKKLDKYLEFYGTTNQTEMIHQLQLIDNPTKKLSVYQYNLEDKQKKIISKNIYFFDDKVFFQVLN
ncbi:hypothetical protein IGL98_003344 [Enterococcus sp. DIV0840]